MEVVAIDIGATCVRFGSAVDVEPRVARVEEEGGGGPAAKRARYPLPAADDEWVDAVGLASSDALECLRPALQQFAGRAVAVTTASCRRSRALEALANQLFERFQAPAVSVLPAPVAALLGHGRHSGVVLDVGERGVRADAVSEAEVRGSAHNCCGGQCITEGFRHKLEEVLLFSSRPAQFATLPLARTLKQLAGEVGISATAAAKGRAKAAEADPPRLTLPDGSELTVAMPAKDRMALCEPLAAPSAQQGLSPARLLEASLAQLPRATAETLAAHTLVCGGQSAVTGLVDRLRTDALDLSAKTVRFTAPHGREHAAWRGLAIASALPQYNHG
eukprot:TRINITY_DN16752_c0_g1_i2.p1 TRINITY_DN16752_c0_g1~~TRINITY_DN16752_c0_g1_i2.p1  ORF type:complete len:348 (+),score=99.56 TRINITY_DN16752_c0_g1_i2:48-1046(+)